MSLEVDAIVCSANANLAKDKITKKILPNIEKDLDIDEQISILFLMSSPEFLNIAYDEIIYLLERNNTNMISEWIDKFKILEWEEKLLESLFLIQNIYVIKKLGFSQEERSLFRERYQCDTKEISPNLNRVLKTLYFLSENLIEKEKQLLVSKFERNPKMNRDELELYLLFWIKTEIITVSEQKANLNQLLLNLKKIHFNMDNAIYVSLENWNEKSKYELFRNVQDAYQSLECSLTSVPESERPIIENLIISDQIYDSDKGLCFIINQEKFSSRWPNRKGTQRDVQKLQEIFESFSYEVQIKENLMEAEIREELKIIGNYTKENYDCIVICILSHGEKRTIVTKDCKYISLDEIRDLICTQQLKNVVKIVIVQACQGEFLGQDTIDGAISEEDLVFDGPTEKVKGSKKLKKNIHFADFVMFISTIPDFQSIRNTKEGSWFIQAICKVLENEDTISWNELALKVKNQVINERGTIYDNETIFKNIVQIPEIIYDRLTKNLFFRKKERNTLHVTKKNF